VPPELVTFVPADYPAEALAAKLTGQVILRLDLDVEGHVTQAVVDTPAGHGFDEAAQAACMKFVFRPALRDGKPTPARILYRYDFTLKPAVEPLDELPPAPAPATLEGTVRVGEQDVPLAGALLRVTAADGTVREVRTDADGHFALSGLTGGALTVSVQAAGYTDWSGSEALQAGESLSVVYRLHATADVTEVMVRGERQDREVTRRTLERKELALVPGTGGDALKAVQTLPGVARPPAMSGMIITRGSGPNGTAMFVDGTFTPILYHFGGLTSVIPTEMIEAIDFYPGNFSARYGRVTGGILDVRLREMETDGKYHGLAQADLIDGRVLLRGPLPLAPGWNFEIAGRRSYVDAWLGPLLEDSVGVRTAPVYYDWQGFAETKPTATSRLRIGVFGSEDRLSMVVKEVDAEMAGMGNSFHDSTGVTRLQVLYDNQFSKRWALKSSVATGTNDVDIAFGSMYIKERSIPLMVRGELSYQASDSLTFRAGPDVIYHHAKVDVRATRPPEPGEPDPGPYATQPLFDYHQTLEVSAPAVYAEADWSPTRRAKVVLGGRLDYFSLNDKVDFSPRLNARYDLHSGFPRTTAKAGVGLFLEPPEAVQIVDEFGTPGLRSNRAVHYSAGVEQELAEGVDLSLEGFYKDMSQLVVSVANADGTSGYDNVGTGRVLGLETLFRFKPTSRLFGWLSYTLSRSTRVDGPGEASHLFVYDQTHNLTLLASYDLGRGWQLGGRFRYTSGNPYTPCVGGILQAGAGSYVCRTGDDFSERMPAFHQLDVRVDKTWSFQSWKLTTYLDVQNAYNRQNAEGVSYNYNFTRPEYDTGLPIIPSLGLRGEF